MKRELVIPNNGVEKLFVVEGLKGSVFLRKAVFLYLVGRGKDAVDQSRLWGIAWGIKQWTIKKGTQI